MELGVYVNSQVEVDINHSEWEGVRVKKASPDSYCYAYRCAADA